jgi:hypothetical protein
VSPAEEEKLKDLQSEVDDARSEVTAAYEAILEDLGCAESCETEADFRANVKAAIRRIAAISAALQTLKEAK